jgi:hypothetical protein
MNVLIDANVALDVMEDNMSLACAINARLDAIVTRDPKGFAGSPIPVLSLAELLAILAKAADA